MHRTAQQQAAGLECIALKVEVHHIALGVAEVHHIVLEGGGAHRIVLLMEEAVGGQEVDHREHEHYSLVAAENGTALLVGTVLVVVGPRTVAHREVGLLRMATAGADVAVGEGGHIAD